MVALDRHMACDFVTGCRHQLFCCVSHPLFALATGSWPDKVVRRLVRVAVPTLCSLLLLLHLSMQLRSGIPSATGTLNYSVRSPYQQEC